MLRRPLCTVTLVFVLAVMIGHYLFPPEIPPVPYEEKEKVSIEGIVERVEYQESQEPVWKRGQQAGDVTSVPTGSRGDVLTAKAREETELQQVIHLRQPGGTRLMCYPEAETAVKIGQRVRIRGTVSYFKRARNPGAFDAREYYHIYGYSYRLYRAEVIAASASYSHYREGLHRIRRILATSLERNLAPQEAAILKTMILGDKSTLNPETKKLYQDSGIIHILAISGLHISILGMGLYRILRRLYLKPLYAAPMVTAVLISYGVMTGMGASCVRAIGMFFIAIGGDVSRRTYDMVTALSLMAAAMLTGNPYLVFHSGFLLSFGAIVAIAMFLPTWKEIWQADRLRVPGFRREYLPKKTLLWLDLRYGILTALMTSSAVSLITLPILLWFQYVFPVYSILLNLLVLPLMTIVVYDALVVMFLGIWATPLLMRILSSPDHFLLSFYELLCRLQQHLPGNRAILGAPSVPQIVMYYALLLSVVISIGLRRRWKVLLLMLAVVLLCLRPRTGVELHFLDVGQGDGIVVELPDGTNYLIDGGSTSQTDIGAYQILPFLKSEGIGTLDAIFVTHPDEDHISGVLEILKQSTKEIQVKRLVLPNVSKRMKVTELSELVSVAADAGVEVNYIDAGDEWMAGKVTFTCLSPREELDTNEVNEISEVLLMRYFDFTALLTGDITGVPELEMADLLVDLLPEGERLDVLKVAHHGSAYSTPSSFLEVASPRLAVISCGVKNRYGHPHEELIERLTDAQVPYLSTADCGEISITVRPHSKMRVRRYLKAP